MTGLLRASCAMTLCCAWLGSLASAHASPWTLPQHKLVLSTSTGFASATEEHLNDGTRQAFPLRGQFRSSSLTLGARYGFTDRLELDVQATFKQVSYRSEPVILDLNGPEEMLDLPSARDRVIDFDSSRFGAADMNIALRYGLARGPIMVAPELGLKVPLGYEGPRGTFDNFDAYFAGLPNAQSLETSGNGVLGDGQVDAQAGLLLGSYLPWTSSFIRAEAAYRLRFGAPGDQLVAAAKVGQFLADRGLVFVGVRWAKTITEGRSVGTSFIDTNPTQPARDYQFASVRPVDLFLDRDFTILEAGVIVPLDKIDLQVAYERTVAGRNVSRINTVNVSVTLSFPDATRQVLPDATAPVDVAGEEEEEVEVIEEVIIVPVPAPSGAAEEGSAPVTPLPAPAPSP